MFTYDEDIFSDLYKDVNGFRPRSHEFYSASPERKQQIWDNLLVELDMENRLRDERDQKAIADFEAMIYEIRLLGAATRKDAIRWLMQAEQDDYVYYDPSYMNYSYGLPYTYSII